MRGEQRRQRAEAAEEQRREQQKRAAEAADREVLLRENEAGYALFSFSFSFFPRFLFHFFCFDLFNLVGVLMFCLGGGLFLRRLLSLLF